MLGHDYNQQHLATKLKALSTDSSQNMEFLSYDEDLIKKKEIMK